MPLHATRSLGREGGIAPDRGIEIDILIGTDRLYPEREKPADPLLDINTPRKKLVGTKRRRKRPDPCSSNITVSRHKKPHSGNKQSTKPDRNALFQQWQCDKVD